MTTITHEQFMAACSISNVPETALRTALWDLGFTIAPPDPPEAMVNLAREIAENAMKGRFYSADASGYRCAGAESALAALQHAAEAVREHTSSAGWCEPGAILRKLGAVA